MDAPTRIADTPAGLCFGSNGRQMLLEKSQRPLPGVLGRAS